MSLNINWSELYHARNLVKTQFPSIWRIPLVKKEMSLLGEFLRPGVRILEIGAGDRRMREKIKEICPSADYKSFDIDRSTFQDFYELNEVSGRFDLVFGFELIEHMSPAEGLSMLSALRSHIDSAGTLILGTPNLYHPHRYFGDITHVTPYKYEELGSIMVLAGYNVKGVYRKYNDAFFYRVFRLYVLVWLHKWMSVDFANTIFVEVSPKID